MVANNKRKKKIMWVCFIAYLLFLSYLLIFSRYFGQTEYGGDEYSSNLTLFQEIGRYVKKGMRTGEWYLFITNVCGNVAMFVPVGIFLPQLWKRCKNVFLTTLICLELSLFAEITQLVTQLGSFDVDDLLLNTLGGLCGYILFRMWRMSRGKKTKNL